MTIAFDKALRDLQRAVGPVAKNKKAHHYSYATLDAIDELVEPHLGDTWAFFDEVEFDRVVTRLVNFDLKELKVSSIGFDPATDPQDTGKTLTYFQRYNRRVLLALRDEDNDATGVKRATTKRTSSRRRRSTEQEVY